MKEIDRLEPRAFTRFCMSIGAVPSSYIAGLTIEEQLLWFCSYLEKEVIPAVNNNGEAVTELQNLYIQLKQYVDDYFDNLDVQEEINNKLDDMAESGQLAEIIAQFLDSSVVLKFDTMSDLEAAESLIEGNIVEVFGEDEVGDGFVDYFIVTSETTDIPLQNELYAKKIYNEKVDGSYLIDEIEQHELYVENSKSTVQVFRIPHTDKLGKEIPIQHGFSDDIVVDTPFEETPTHFSNRKNATLCVNASIGCVNPESVWYDKILGLIIHNGVVVTDSREYYDDPSWYMNRYILGLKNNGLLKAYVGNAEAQTLLDDGVVESWQGFIPVLVDGQNNRENLLHKHNWTSPTYSATSDETPVQGKIYYVNTGSEYVGYYGLNAFNPLYTYYEQTNTLGRYPRQIIAQNGTTKDFYILSSNGKGKTSNLGSTFEEVITLLKYIDPDITFAYALDEGGSTATAYKNINRINNTDDQNIYTSQTSGIGLTERKVSDFIYFAKETETEKDKDLNYLFHEIQELKNAIKDLKMSNDLNNILRSGTGISIENWDKNAPNNLYLAFKQIQNDGTLKHINSLVANPSSAPNSLNFYDQENLSSVARIKNDGTRYLNENGDGLDELANIFAKIKTVTNCDTIANTGLYYCTGTATNAPYHDTDYRANVILNVRIKADDTIACQLGFMIGGAPSSIAYRCFIQGTTWTAWKYASIS